MVKLENKLKKKIKIGVRGGSFDPAHKGHLAISNEALKRFKLKNIIFCSYFSIFCTLKVYFLKIFIYRNYSTLFT